jgi:hypothetical protein
MQPNQGRGCSLIKVAVHGIPDLPVQLLQAVRLRVDGRCHGAGPVGAVVGFLHDKKDFVHGPSSCLSELWQRLLATPATFEPSPGTA